MVTRNPSRYAAELTATNSPNGTPVDLGIVWSTQTPAEALPCAAPIANATTTPPTANPNCNGFLSYSQVGRPRNFMPTERLRFQSNYFEKLQMEGSFGYSTSDNQIPDFDEILNGFVTRSATRESTTAGPANAKRVSVNADGSGVYSVTDKFRIQDSFRWDDWRIPGFWATGETNIFGAQARADRLGAAPIFCSTKCLPPRPPRLPRSAPRLLTARPAARFTPRVPARM